MTEVFVVAFTVLHDNVAVAVVTAALLGDVTKVYVVAAIFVVSADAVVVVHDNEAVAVVAAAYVALLGVYLKFLL